jgi:hypothetical protein
MSTLSLLRGMLAFIDNVDGKGAEAYATAILADPNASQHIPGFVTVEMIAAVLESQGPALRRIAENDPDALGQRLFARLGAQPSTPKDHP